MTDAPKPSLFERQMAMYTSYHRDHRNRATHFVGIPAIIVSLMVVLALARFSAGRNFRRPSAHPQDADL